MRQHGPIEAEAIGNQKLGDLLHAVLSVADYRGIDVEWVLCEAIQRNAERIEEEVC